MRKLYFIILFSCFAQFTFGQQQGQFTQFMFNQLNLNPAYAGSRGIPSLMAIYRGQWLGFDNAPRNILANFNAPLFGDRVGFGFGIANQNIGVMNSWQASMAYSYHIPITETTSLRFGLQGSLKQLAIDFLDPSVIIRQSNDPSVLNGASSKFSGNVGLGVYFSTKQFYIGASVPSLYPSEIGLNDTAPRIAKESPHYYLMSGAMLPLTSKMDLKPSLLLKYVQNAPFDADLNLSLVFNKMIHAGLSYRLGGDGSGESIDLTLFYQAKHLGFGLGYDYTLSDIQNYSNGSLEALVRYDFIKERQDMANPRFFY